MRKKPTIQIIVLTVLIFLSLLYSPTIEKFDASKYSVGLVNNPFINKKLLWTVDKKFIKQNHPTELNFESNIKHDIIERAKKLPQNWCIIDCGAHIGDGSIAIAHALKEHNRPDIMVYAIEPSKEKCDYINYIKKINKLPNITVVNCGLSDHNGLHDVYSQSRNLFGTKLNEGNRYNSGAISWTKSNTGTNFYTLDTLVENKTIKHRIGIIHLDIEGMEEEAISGLQKTLHRDRPYLSIEDIKSKNGYIGVLPNFYRYKCMQHQNSTYEAV